MERRLLLVRAVNVGGVSLPMAELREVVAELGAANVATYIASGNAVADIPGDPDAFDRALEAALTKRFGWQREVLSRTPAALRAAREVHPFPVEKDSWSYVSLLSAEPSQAALERAGEIPRGDDEWAVIGRELHLRYAAGAGRATLQQERLTRALGVVGTARNLRTVDKLLALAAA